MRRLFVGIALWLLCAGAMTWFCLWEPEESQRVLCERAERNEVMDGPAMPEECKR